MASPDVTTTAVSPPVPEEAIREAVREAVKAELPGLTRGTIDTWAQDQVDQPLSAMQTVFPKVALTQPPMWESSQHWVPAGWGISAAIGILLILAAMLNHSRHMLQGTDLKRQRNPFFRITVPTICLVLMFVALPGWELMRATQEYIWATEEFNPKDTAQVMGTALPPKPEPKPEPSTSEKVTAVVKSAALRSIPIVGSLAQLPIPSVGGITSSLGIGFGIGTGSIMIILGFLALLAYWVGRILLVLSPIHLGIAAFSDRWEPVAGWADITVRTNLLISVFQVAWWVMRRLPDWMSWTGMNAAVFIVIVLPVLLVVIYLFWLKRLVRVIGDPLMLGGGRVVEGVGQKAALVGKALMVAGAVTGQPGIAAAGSKVTTWGSAAAMAGQQAVQAAQDGGMKQVLSARVQTLLDKGKQLATQPASQEPQGAPPAVPQDGKQPCWRAGSEFVTLVHGTPTRHQSQPPGTYLAGDWTGD